MKNKSVYVLTAIHPKIHNDCKKGHYLIDDKGDVKCSMERIGVFTSVKKAESVIKTLVKQEKKSSERFSEWYDDFFGFSIEEHYIDDALYGSHDYRNISHFESFRTYLRDGTLNCASDVDDRCEKPFAGRKDPVEHIKKGDVAMVWNGSHLTPVLISENAMTSKEWRKRFKPGVKGDFTDDSGIAFIAGYGHCHPFSPTVFPLSCLPYYKINKKTISGMKKAMREYYEEGKI